jgi:hypothetical protein
MQVPQIRYATPERLLQRLTDLRFLSIGMLQTIQRNIPKLQGVIHTTVLDRNIPIVQIVIKYQWPHNKLEAYRNFKCIFFYYFLHQRKKC